MTLYKSIEIVATSDKSWSEAVKAGYAEAKKTVRHIRNIEVIRSDVKVKEDSDELVFRVRMQLTFEVESESASVTPAPKPKATKK